MDGRRCGAASCLILCGAYRQHQSARSFRELTYRHSRSFETNRPSWHGVAA